MRQRANLFHAQRAALTVHQANFCACVSERILFKVVVVRTLARALALNLNSLLDAKNVALNELLQPTLTLLLLLLLPIRSATRLLALLVQTYRRRLCSYNYKTH